jgi:hypothetical protein
MPRFDQTCDLLLLTSEVDMEKVITREHAMSVKYAVRRNKFNAPAIAAAKRLYDQEKTLKYWSVAPYDYNASLDVNRAEEIRTIQLLIGLVKWTQLKVLKNSGMLDWMHFYERLCMEITRARRPAPVLRVAPAPLVVSAKQ